MYTVPGTPSEVRGLLHPVLSYLLEKTSMDVPMFTSMVSPGLPGFRDRLYHLVMLCFISSSSVSPALITLQNSLSGFGPILPFSPSLINFGFCSKS